MFFFAIEVLIIIGWIIFIIGGGVTGIGLVILFGKLCLHTYRKIQLFVYLMANLIVNRLQEKVTTQEARSRNEPLPGIDP